MGLWKQPKTKVWYSFIVDGRCVVTAEESVAVEKEKHRLSVLCGICVRFATPDELIRARVKTVLPKAIVVAMKRAAVA